MARHLCWDLPAAKRIGWDTRRHYDALERAFGAFPLILNKSDLGTLQGMEATEANRDNIYSRVIRRVRQHGVIELHLLH